MKRRSRTMSRRRAIPWLCLAALVLPGLAALIIASPARAGVVIDVKTVYFGQNKADETATIYLDERGVRFDAVEDGRPTSLVFRLGENDEPLCWIIDKQSKTYVEFKRENAESDRSPSAALVSADFKKIASGVKLGGWKCTQYEAFVQGEKQEDLWAAPEKDLGLTARQVSALRRMGEFFSKISTETNAFFQVGRSPDDGGFEGFPVVVVEYRGGRKLEKSEVTAVRSEKLDPSVFALPQGARRQKNPNEP